MENLLYAILALAIIILLMQFYWINLISDTFTEISKNSTERAIKILDIRGKLQT